MPHNAVIEYTTESYLNSPDRVILTPEGCQSLLQVGEKELRAYRKRKSEDFPIPFMPASNSYRYHREKVIQWFADECERQQKRPQG